MKRLKLGLEAYLWSLVLKQVLGLLALALAAGAGLAVIVYAWMFFGR